MKDSLVTMLKRIVEGFGSLEGGAGVHMSGSTSEPYEEVGGVGVNGQGDFIRRGVVLSEHDIGAGVVVGRGRSIEVGGVGGRVKIV